MLSSSSKACLFIALAESKEYPFSKASRSFGDIPASFSICFSVGIDVYSGVELEIDKKDVILPVAKTVVPIIKVAAIATMAPFLNFMLLIFSFILSFSLFSKLYNADSILL
ncbi:hypothetical protein SDC9_208022 [bioreactor metagenome]|uniref:Uncharacterized protein n=1 Tax=bioreactor metagenome TaxID=1076179 RepID=A0A645JIX6_9ZZZZ